jgi:Ca-activated chloride channel family protein
MRALRLGTLGVRVHTFTVGSKFAHYARAVTMKRDRVVIVLIALVAVAALIFFSRSGGDGGAAGGGAQAEAPDGAIPVSFIYSPEKEDLLAPLIEDFNADENEVNGAPVFVRGEAVASGEAEQKIDADQLKPVAWSPSSSLWGRLLNYEADRQLTPDDPPSIVRTPLVIAMWKPMARALGWPKKPIGFDDILALARSNQGWGAYGHPEFGSFKLVHTNPDFSTSGLSAVVAEYYAATGKREGLLTSDIDGAARAKVRDIEQSIVHYGDTTLLIAEQMREGGPGYASAVAMEEATLLAFNEDRAGQPELVAIYPKEGTFFSDNPFFILNGQWVSPAQREGAKAFQEYLAKRITPEVAARSGFRPADLGAQPDPPITLENGADPSQPKQTLSLPSPPVLAKIRDAWREDRKPANVMLVVDVSGSMADEDRLARAKQGLDVFFDQIQPQDRVGLMAFDDHVDQLVPIQTFSQDEGRLRRTVRGLFPGGGTAFRDATGQGFEKVEALAGADDRINAVVVLTDGDDTDSSRSLDSLIQELSSQGDSATQVRVFTIAYSATADGAADALQKIAEASGGQYYEGETENIELVYRSISSFF